MGLLALSCLSLNAAKKTEFKLVKGGDESIFTQDVIVNVVIDDYTTLIDRRNQTADVYYGNQGQKVYVVEVVCDSVQFLETRAARERAQQQQPQVSQDNFYDMKTVELEKDFDNSFDSFDIMEDDIQF